MARSLTCSGWPQTRPQDAIEHVSLCSTPHSAPLEGCAHCPGSLQIQLQVLVLQTQSRAIFIIGVSCSVMSNSWRPHGLSPTRLLCPWGFSRQEFWSGLPCPPPGDLPNPGIKPTSLVSSALAGGFFTPSATWEA